MRVRPLGADAAPLGIRTAEATPLLLVSATSSRFLLTIIAQIFDY